jgi:transcriptional regulator with XRE-family HTH domain
MTTELGDVLRDARREQGWSLKELGEKLESPRSKGGLSPQYLNDLEHGRRTPSEDILKQLATVFKLEVETLRALAKRTSPDVEDYLMRHSGASAGVSRVFRKATAAGFTNWKTVEEFIPRAARTRKKK